MADETPPTTTQCEDTPKHNSHKLDHMNKISSLTEGHVYALKYFPKELQVLLTLASLNFDKRASGHIGSVLGQPKESRDQKLHVPLKPLEILWDDKYRTTLFCDQSRPPSTCAWQTDIADSEEGLSILQQGYEFAAPFSTVLTVVDREHLVMLDVFFRYCLLLQGYDTAIEGFKYGFWTWFERLCRHVAE